MSQRGFQSPRKEKRQRKIPHSEKSSVSSAKESHKSEQKKTYLEAKLNDLIIKRNWAEKQANKWWKYAKKCQAQGRMDWVLVARTACKQEEHRVKRYNREIIEVEKRIDKFLFVFSVGPQKRENFAMMKVDEPPSDNQE